MNTKFNIYAMIIDQTESENRYHLYISMDTKENKADVYTLNGLLNEDVKSYDTQLQKIFQKKPDYHLSLKAEALVKLTDQLGGITVNQQPMNGKEALAYARSGKYLEVLDSICQAVLKKGNLLKTIPGLLSTLKESYETDMPLMDIIKVALGEINDLSKWKVYIHKLNKENIRKVLG